MSEQRRYTSKELREAADTFWVGGVICEVKDAEGCVVRYIKDDVIKAMLRQAADAEEERELEENVKWSTDKYAKDEYDKIVAERDALKAQVAERDKRIEHIVKDANAMLNVNSLIHDAEANSYTRNQVYTVLTSILDIAKGK